MTERHASRRSGIWDMAYSIWQLGDGFVWASSEVELRLRLHWNQI